MLLGKAPFDQAAAPTVTVEGMGTSQHQQMTWGKDWLLNNLIFCSYTITAPAINNGDQYYQAVISNPVIVVDKQTVPVQITYQAVATGKVTVSMTGASDQTESVTFTGKQYAITNVVHSGDTIVLPVDAYITNAGQHGTAPGMMIWSVQKKPAGAISNTNPDSNLVAKTICQQYGTTACDQGVNSIATLHLEKMLG